MYTLITRPGDAHTAAHRLGFTGVDFQTMPDFKLIVERPLDTISGRLVMQNIEAGWDYSEKDTDRVSDIKRLAKNNLSDVRLELVAANEGITRASRDSRYSAEGRVEAMRKSFFTFAGQRAVFNFSAMFDAYFTALNTELARIINPDSRYRYANDDVKAATIDSEYRSVIREMDNGKRFIYLSDLATSNADSPVINAVLRADPLASGISHSQHRILSMLAVVGNRADALYGLWGAGCLLDAAAYQTYWATVFLANSVGLRESKEIKTVSLATAECPARLLFAQSIKDLVEAAPRVASFARGGPDPEKEDEESA